MAKHIHILVTEDNPSGGPPTVILDSKRSGDSLFTVDRQAFGSSDEGQTRLIAFPVVNGGYYALHVTQANGQLGWGLAFVHDMGQMSEHMQGLGYQAWHFSKLNQLFEQVGRPERLPVPGQDLEADRRAAINALFHGSRAVPAADVAAKMAPAVPDPASTVPDKPALFQAPKPRLKPRTKKPDDPLPV